jgi:hypothetical protein
LPEQQEFFLNYSPPNQLEALQIDRRRLLIGKEGAFQPVKQRFDGSYTVIWRLLNQFPDPKITDLEEYVYLE